MVVRYYCPTLRNSIQPNNSYTRVLKKTKKSKCCWMAFIFSSRKRTIFSFFEIFTVQWHCSVLAIWSLFLKYKNTSYMDFQKHFFYGLPRFRKGVFDRNNTLWWDKVFEFAIVIVCTRSKEHYKGLIKEFIQKSNVPWRNVYINEISHQGVYVFQSN